MSNLGLLIKNNLNCFLSAFRGKKKRLSTISASIILVVCALAIVALYSFEAYTMFDAFKEVKLFSLPLFHGIMISLTVLVLIGTMRVSSTPKTNDTELLLSLPIKKIDIIISKTLNKYIFDLAFVVFLFVPHLVLYQVFTNFSLSITICGIVITFILPLLSVGISYVYDFIITRIFNRIRVGNILKSLVSVFVFVLIMALMIIKTGTYGFAEATSIDAYFADRFFSNLFLQFILKQDVFSIVFCVSLCVIGFVLGLYLFSVNFGKVIVGYSGKAGELKFSESLGGFRRLFKKELNYYASTPAYIVNTCIGSVVILVTGIILSITGVDGLNSMLGASIESDFVGVLLALVFCFSASTVYTSACSLSLEGKNFWIIKTSPVSEEAVFFSKILLNILLVCPFVVISSVISTLCLGISFKYFLVMLFAPILLNIAMSIGGLFINLWLPKLDWQEETQVVKGSMSSLVTMLLGMFLSLLPVAIALIFETITLDVVIIISISIYLLLAVLFTVLLLTVGKKLYRKL